MPRLLSEFPFDVSIWLYVCAWGMVGYVGVTAVMPVRLDDDGQLVADVVGERLCNWLSALWCRQITLSLHSCVVCNAKHVLRVMELP